jgi:hypothetical protein
MFVNVVLGVLSGPTAADLQLELPAGRGSSLLGGVSTQRMHPTVQQQQQASGKGEGKVLTLC